VGNEIRDVQKNGIEANKVQELCCCVCIRFGERKGRMLFSYRFVYLTKQQPTSQEWFGRFVLSKLTWAVFRAKRLVLPALPRKSSARATKNLGDSSEIDTQAFRWKRYAMWFNCDC